MQRTPGPLAGWEWFCHLSLIFVSKRAWLLSSFKSLFQERVEGKSPCGLIMNFDLWAAPGGCSSHALRACILCLHKGMLHCISHVGIFTVRVGMLCVHMSCWHFVHAVSMLCMNIGMLCMNIGMLCMNICMLCMNIGMLCMNIGMLCMNTDIVHEHWHVVHEHWHVVHEHWHVVHEHWHVVHACLHSQLNKCYRHVRNIVHVKFDTDHPPYTMCSVCAVASPPQTALMGVPTDIHVTKSGWVRFQQSISPTTWVQQLYSTPVTHSLSSPLWWPTHGPPALLGPASPPLSCPCTVPSRRTPTVNVQVLEVIHAQQLAIPATYIIAWMSRLWVVHVPLIQSSPCGPRSEGTCRTRRLREHHWETSPAVQSHTLLWAPL